jgi:hypothetical protein
MQAPEQVKRQGKSEVFDDTTLRNHLLAFHQVGYNEEAGQICRQGSWDCELKRAALRQARQHA